MDFDADDESKISYSDRVYIQNAIKDKLKLGSTGREVYYLSYGPPTKTRKNGRRRIVCHLCWVSNMVSAADLEKHITGKDHMKNLQKDLSLSKLSRPFQLVASSEGKHPIIFKIYAGQDIPIVTERLQRQYHCKAWGLDTRAEKKELKLLVRSEATHFFNEKFPLMGLEYIIVMMTNNKVVHFCVLCDRYLPSTVYTHVINVDHEHKYIMRHFPTFYNKVVSLIEIADSNRKQGLVHHLFRELYQKCEKKKGLQRIKSANFEAFEKTRDLVIKPILDKKHYGENDLNPEEIESSSFSDSVAKSYKLKDPLGEYPPRLSAPSKGLSRTRQKRIFWKNFYKKMRKFMRRKAMKKNNSDSGGEIGEEYSKNGDSGITGTYDNCPDSRDQKSIEEDENSYDDNDADFLKDGKTMTYETNFELEECPQKPFAQWLNKSGSYKENCCEPMHEKPIQILPILRVLSALENHLGSLGPTCLELLEETLNKLKNNQLDEMLTKQENLIFFATVKEMLKGLLITKSFVKEPTELIHKLIKDIEELISMMEVKMNQGANIKEQKPYVSHSNDKTNWQRSNELPTKWKNPQVFTGDWRHTSIIPESGSQNQIKNKYKWYRSDFIR